jgi:signal transduction histidine kinase/ActR/RegA family two-component response regulator
VRAKGLIVLAIPLIALIGTTTASIVLQHTERQERSVAAHEFEVVNAANQVLADAVNAETGVRGYAATGGGLFLAPYRLTLAKIAVDRRAFKTAAATAGLGGRQDVVDATAGRELTKLAAIRAAVSGGASPRSLLGQLTSGKRTMDLLRAQVASLIRGPAAQLVAHRNLINHLEGVIGALDIAGLAFGLLGGLLGVVLFTAGISARVVAAEANADRLGEGQPLKPVARSRDDIGRLAESLVRAEDLLNTRAGELTAARDEALQATGEVTAARDEALRATQAKTKFLSSTSHELRTPMNSILGFAQLLEISDLNAEDQDSVVHILGAGRHLLSLINELIDIARIESGDLTLSIEPVTVVPLVAEACQLMAPLAADRSIQITQDTAGPSLATRADRQRFSQVLVNLISNAIKYNKVGGTIRIYAQAPDDDCVALTVTDTGRGMSLPDLERIFLPFERLGAEQTAVEGTGIGLPLARTLSEAMNGSLSASSVVGEGSTFTLTLPRAPDDISVPASVPAPASHALAGPTLSPDDHADSEVKILYVEDNPANVEVVARFLRNRSGIHLQSFANGREGLAYAFREIPDLILLDLHLQDVHGQDVLNELKAQPATARIPVIVLSADATPGVIKRLLAHGAIAYLTKPLDLSELGAMIDSLVRPPADARSR